MDRRERADGAWEVADRVDRLRDRVRRGFGTLCRGWTWLESGLFVVYSHLLRIQY